MTKKNWTSEEQAKFRAMCFAGISNKKIAEAFGVTVASVNHCRSRWGLTMTAVNEAKAKAEAETKAAAGAEPIDDIPTPPKPILSEKGKKKKTSKKAAAKKAAAEEPTPPDEEEKIVIDAQAFFALAHELSENAENMEKLNADNLALKEQLLAQSQHIAELQDALEIKQAASTAQASKIELIGNAAAILVMEFEKMEHFLGRSGLYRLFHRYKSLTKRAKDSLEAAEEAIKKEADNACND